MAESLAGASSSLEVLEASEEGKKKSKFKAFKSFFGKKKKKEPENIQEEIWRSPSLSSGRISNSFLLPAQEDQVMEPKPTSSSMGTKAVSHDSIFLLESESERSASKLHPAMESQRGRPLQMLASRTLPRAVVPEVQAALSAAMEGAVGQSMSRTGVRATGSKITKFPSLHLCKPSISPPVIRADRTSVELGKTSIDEKALQSPKKKSSPHHTLTPKKSISESSSGPDQSQPSPRSTHQPSSFVSSVTIESCLDASAARHRISLNPRKQKKKNILPPTVKPKQEETSLPPVFKEEKTTTRPKEADHKEQRKDSTETMDIPTIFKEKPLRNVFQAFPASVAGMTSATAEDNVSLKRLPPRGQYLGQPEAVFSSDSPQISPPQSASEDDRNSEDQLVPVCPFPSKRKSKDDREGIHKSESLDVGLSSNDQQLSSGYSPQFLRKSEAEETSSDSEISSEEQQSSEEMTSGHVSQSFKDIEDFSESKSFTMGSTSEEQLAAVSHFRDSQDSEEKEISTESSSYIEKYNSSEDFSTAEEDQPIEHAHKALGQPKDQDVPSVSKNIPKVQRVHAKHMSPIQQQASTSVAISTRQSRSEGPLSPGHSAKSWVRPKFEHQVSASSESIAANWGIFMHPVPPRKSSKPQMRYKVGQMVSSSPEIKITEVVSMEALPPMHHSQQEARAGPEHGAEVNIVMRPPRCPSVRPKVKKEVCLDTESAEVVRHAFMEPLSPKRHFQSLRRPYLQKPISVDPRSPAYEGSMSVDLRAPPHQSQSRMKPPVQQQVSSVPESAAFERASQFLSKSGMKTKAYPSVAPRSECVATEKVISVGPPQHSKYSFQSLPNPHGPQDFPESTSFEGATLMERQPSSKPMVKTKFQAQMTQDSLSMSNRRSSLVEQIPAKQISPQANPKFKQQVCESPNSAGAEVRIPAQLMSPRYVSQPQLTPPFEQISAPPKNVPATWCIPMEPSLSRMHFQPLNESVSKQVIPTGSVSTSAQGSSSEQLFQSLVDPIFKEQLPAGPQRYASKGDMPAKLRPRRHHSQPSMRSSLRKIPKIFLKEEVISGLQRASSELNDLVGPMPPKSAPQSMVNPEFEPQVSLSPESVIIEESIFKDVRPSRNPSRILIKQRVQEITSSFESESITGSMSGKPLPPKYPTPYSTRSKVQEMSSRLENAAAEKDICKKGKHSKAPSQSFVKYMTQRVFAENPAIERATHVNSMTPRRISRALLKPKLEEIKYDWNAYLEGDISLKKPPMKHSLQSLWKPDCPQDVPIKQGSSKSKPPAGELSQATGKLKYRNEVTSVSVSSPENKKSSGEQLPTRNPSQDLNVSEFQPPILSTGFMNIPVECREPEGHLPPSQPHQAFGGTEYQHVYSSSTSAASEGSTYEKNTGKWSLPKGQYPPKKTKKYSHVSGEFDKSAPTSVAKPGKFTTAPAQKTPISEDTYSKEKFLQSGDSSSSSSISKADVENVFGVRLRSISSQKSKTKKPDMLTQPPSLPCIPISSSVGKEHIQKSASPGFHGTSEKVSPTPSFIMKQQTQRRQEGMAKKQPPYNLPGKSPGQQSDHAASEPVWITMAKQKQKFFAACDFVNEPKPKIIYESKAETQEPRYEGAITATETRLRRDHPFTHPKQDNKAKMKLPKSGKSVTFEEQRIFRSATRERETKRSKSLPPRLQKVEEPVWFSMAKKKAKAWSHITDTIQ